MDSNITLQTKQMIDSLKAVCTNFGLGNASSEYKIITDVICCERGTRNRP